MSPPSVNVPITLVSPGNKLAETSAGPPLVPEPAMEEMKLLVNPAVPSRVPLRVNLPFATFTPRPLLSVPLTIMLPAFNSRPPA